MVPEPGAPVEGDMGRRRCDAAGRQIDPAVFYRVTDPSTEREVARGQVGGPIRPGRDRRGGTRWDLGGGEPDALGRLELDLPRVPEPASPANRRRSTSTI